MLKSRALLATLMLTAISLTGCSAINDMFGNMTDTSEWTTDTGSDDAITVLNRYTDLINSAHEQMQYLDSDVAYFESDIDSGYDPYFTCTFTLYDRDSLEYDTTNPTGLEDTEAEDLKTQAAAIFATIDTTEGLCKDLSKYVTAEDYKTDDYAQGKALVTQLYDSIDTYYDEHNTLLETLDGLYDKYSTFVVDPNDPESVAIDNMNKDLDIADEILTLIEDSVTDGTFVKMAEVQAAYDNLETNLTAHSGDNEPDFDSDSYTTDYTDFYNTLEVSFMPTIKRSLRDMESQDSDALSSDYYDVLDGYNSMVDSYNYFLDASSY